MWWLKGVLKISVTTVGSEVSTARISSFIKDFVGRVSPEAHSRAERLADSLVPVSFCLLAEQ